MLLAARRGGHAFHSIPFHSSLVKVKASVQCILLHHAFEEPDRWLSFVFMFPYPQVSTQDGTEVLPDAIVETVTQGNTDIHPLSVTLLTPQRNGRFSDQVDFQIRLTLDQVHPCLRCMGIPPIFPTLQDQPLPLAPRLTDFRALPNPSNFGTA